KAAPPAPAPFEGPQAYLVSACLQDDANARAAAHIPTAAFTDPRLARVFGCLKSGMSFQPHLPESVSEWVRETGMTEAQLLRLETLAGLGTGFAGWLREVEDAWGAREFSAIAGDITRGVPD